MIYVHEIKHNKKCQLHSLVDGRSKPGRYRSTQSTNGSRNRVLYTALLKLGPIRTSAYLLFAFNQFLGNSERGYLSRLKDTRSAEGFLHPSIIHVQDPILSRARQNPALPTPTVHSASVDIGLVLRCIRWTSYVYMRFVLW